MDLPTEIFLELTNASAMRDIDRIRSILSPQQPSDFPDGGALMSRKPQRDPTDDRSATPRRGRGRLP